MQPALNWSIWMRLDQCTYGGEREEVWNHYDGCMGRLTLSDYAEHEHTSICDLGYIKCGTDNSVSFIISLMVGLFHDTIVAYSLRFAFGSKAFPYPEEEDPSLWTRMLHREKSTTDERRDDPAARPATTEVIGDEIRSTSGQSSRTHVSISDTKNPAAPTDSVDPEIAGTETLLVDWYGPDDPENPLNWGSKKKIWVLFLTCLWTFTMYLGSAVYTAGIRSVSEEFGVSTVAATLGLTVFVLGYGTGPMILAPLSEIPQFGRMPIYIISCFLFTVLQVPTMRSSNFGMLLAFRFITGWVGSPILATGGATIADMYIPKRRAYGLAIWGLFVVAAPCMAPLVGGFAAHAHNWRWTIWELLWLSAFTLIVLIFFFPETSSSNILYRRALRLRKLTQNPNIRTQAEIDVSHLTTRDVTMMMLVRPFTLNFQEPVIFIFNLYIALVYALLYCWFESFPIVFGGIYHFREQLIGLAFLGVLIGCILCMPPFFAYLYYVQEPKYDEKGNIKPEDHMPAAIVGAFFIPVCLFWFGWSSRESIHWIMPIIGSSFFPIGGILLFNSIFNYLTDAYPLYIASVLAGNDLMRSSFGAAFPLFAGALYNNLGVGWASTLLGLISCGFVPMPFLLYRYGRRIRLASKRARHDI